MPVVEKAITFRVDADLKAAFEEAADAEHRSMKGALINLMERRVAEFNAERDAAKAAA